MPTAQERWRDLLRSDRASIRAHRMQSAAFLRGENLTAIPLKFNSKYVLPQNVAGNFAAWTDVDYPDATNWGARFPPRTRHIVGVEIDVDGKPVSGEWRRVDETQCKYVAQHIIQGISKVGEIDCRHRWGRASQGGWGHVYFPVAISGKEDVLRLGALHMREHVRLGDMRFRIEVRLSPDGKEPGKKCITLPGSTYPGRADPEAIDRIDWQILHDLGEDATFPALPPQPINRLGLGLYAGLLTAVLENHWGEGNRHELAMMVGGILAREADQGEVIDEGDAERIMIYLCEAFNDDERQDRMECLRNSFSALQAGKNVTGYTRLAEIIGDDAKKALLRLRGGGDPDALAELFTRVAYVKAAAGREASYVDLSTDGHVAPLVSKDAIRAAFHPHPLYPAIPRMGKAPIALIDVVIGSKRLLRYDRAVRLPGVPFNTPMVRNGDRWREATELELAEPGGAGLALNIGTGWATPIPDEPETAARERWFGLWRRHLKPLTGNNAIAVTKLERAIAWAVQHPLEKIPFGIVMSGGQGIGKSVLFNTILKRLLGSDLVATTNVMALDSQYRLSELEGAKFYVVEEINMSSASLPLRELLKDLMKNLSMRVNRKYGSDSTVENFAIPIFLTNERNPGLVIRGQRERALAFIEGDTQDGLNLSAKDWQGHVNKIAAQVKEFLAALEQPAIREAAMHYFANLKVERGQFEDNSDLGDSADPRDGLDTLDEAFCTILEQGEMHPRLRGEWSLDRPFKMDMLLAGLRHHLNDRNASKFRLTPTNVGSCAKRLFGSEVLQRVQFRHGKEVRSVYHFNLRYGSLLERVFDKLQVRIEPYRELSPSDQGENPKPDNDACRAAHEFDCTNLSNGGGRY